MVLMLTTASTSVVAAQNDGIPVASYCDIRKSETKYDRTPVRVQVVWRYDRKQFSYIHSEPECVGRTALGFGGICPAMESLPLDLDKPFEADVLITGLFYSRAPGKHMDDAGGDGTHFLAGCIESFKERPIAPEANQRP
jgi:hypothetical protein